MVSDPMDNPLYRASQTVAAELIADGNTFMNASSLEELPKSGDRLEINQIAG